MEAQMLEGGFVKGPQDAAHAFRAIMTAMARPGDIRETARRGGCARADRAALRAARLRVDLGPEEPDVRLAPALRADVEHLRGVVRIRHRDGPAHDPARIEPEIEQPLRNAGIVAQPLAAAQIRGCFFYDVDTTEIYTARRERKREVPPPDQVERFKGRYTAANDQLDMFTAQHEVPFQKVFLRDLRTPIRQLPAPA